MNKAHRVVWNKARDAFVVAHELASPRGKSSSTKNVMAASIAAAMLTLAGAAAAQTTTTITTPSGSQNVLTGETLVNNSTISSTNSRGVAVGVTGGAIAGAIVNNGTIVAPSFENGVGILVTGSTVSSGITNAGMINAYSVGIGIRSVSSVASLTNSGVVTAGVEISGSSLGAISNAAGATISGGLSVYGGSASGVVNAGSIVGGIGVGGGAIVSSIINTGTISGSRGISVGTGAQVGSITNSGLISTAGYGVYIVSGGSVASIVNQSGGAISGGGYGIFLVGGSVGTISNSAGATISGVAGGVTVATQAAAVTIVNSGTISSGTGIGVDVYNGGLFSITNAGTISGGNGGLGVGNMAGGNILNLAGAVVSGGQFGLDVSGSVGATVSSIVNAGTINSSASNGYGVELFNLSVGTFSNLAGGVISGASGVTSYGATVSSFDNAGQIMGNYAVSVNSGQVGVLMNSGTISGTSVGLGMYSSAIGSLVNHGTITAARYGSIISGGSVTGGILNTGLISGAGDAGLLLQSATVTGGISNTSGGVISGASGLTLYFDQIDNVTNGADSTISGLTLNGVHVTSESTITGNIVNAGVISGHSEGIYINSGSSVMGQVQNSGTISGGDDGIKVKSGSTLAGGILNSGSITGAVNGVLISSAAVIGNITNSGLIQGGVAGVSYLNNSAASGGIFNSGLISGGTVGVALVSSSIQGSVTNLAGGTISGGQFGVAISKATVSGGVGNSGVISGGAVGVQLIASSIQGSINNVAGGTISGGQIGVALSAATVSGGLNNAGTISGGTYSVLTTGGAPLPITVSGANTAAFIGDVKALTSVVTLASGATFTGTNAFDVQSFMVDSGAKFNFGAMPSSANGAAGVTVSEGLSNAGTVALGLGTARLTGSYAQASSGVLALSAASNTSYGKLVASGTATLASNADLVVSVASNSTLSNHETLAGVLQSSGLTASTFDVTDNSDLYSFKGQADGNNVDLVVSIDAILLPATISRGNINAEGAAAAVDSIITSSAGIGPFSSLINDLSKLQTPTQLSHAASQLLPALSGDGNIAILGALYEMNNVVQSRTEGNLGVSTGIPYMSDSAAWVKPFGSWAELGSTGSAPGFSSGVAGVLIGGDGAISNRARVGLAFGYANADVSGKADSAPNQDRINLYQLMGYGSYLVMPGTEVSAEIDGGYGTNDTTRNIEFAGEKANASFNSTDAHFGVGIAHPFAVSDSTTVVPSARIDYTWVQSDGYQEGGAGPLNLNTGSTSYEQLLTSVNVKLLQKVNDFMSVFGNVGFGYDSMARSNTAIVASFAGAPGLPFTTQGVGLKPRVFLGGLGITSQAHGMTPEISAKYDVERRSNFSNQTVSFKARWGF